MSNLSSWLSWAQSHGTALLATAGAVLIAVVIVAVVLAARKASLAPVVRSIAIPLVLLWEAQGVYGVALRLHAPREMAWAFAGVTSAVLLGLASYAHKHFVKHGNLGPNGRVMWLVAVPMGIVVAANAGSLTGAMLRVLLPLLSLVMFRAPYLPDEPAGQQSKQGSWRLTPRRVGVSLGLIDPADTDLTAVHAERTIRLLTRHAAGYHRGTERLRSWHGRRFEKLALMADDDMITEAGRRVRRVHTGLASTAPVPIAGPTDEPAAIATDRPTGGPTASATAIAPAPPNAPLTAGPTDEPLAIGAPEPPAGPTSDGVPAAVARVRRKGSGACTEDEIKAAIRELRKTDPEITKYGIGQALKGNKGTIGPGRAGRLLAEVQAERPSLSAVKKSWPGYHRAAMPRTRPRWANGSPPTTSTIWDAR